jgi:hypothetical protein
MQVLELVEFGEALADGEELGYVESESAMDEL